MVKIAVIVLADIETHEGLGRVVNAMEVVKECLQAGDEVRLIFDGAGTRWIGELTQPGHKAHRLFEEIRGRAAGVCAHCARAFNMAAHADTCSIALLDEFEGHPRVRALMLQDYRILTF